MNQRILSGLSATLLITTLGTATAGQAQQVSNPDQASESSLSATQVRQRTTTATPASKQPRVQQKEVVKVGEMQSSRPAAVAPAEAIAKIQAYESTGRQVAILYVRDIPVLTFWDSRPANAQRIQVGATPARATKTASRQPGVQDRGYRPGELEGNKQYSAASDGLEMDNNPVWRATAVAAKLNQLYRSQVDAKAIAVRWNAQDKAFNIEVNGQEVVQVNERTFLPDTTRNLAQDALQATNRLRRLIGNAPPLREVAGMPKQRRAAQVALRSSVRSEIRGIASWYGPGFHGNRSASGEIYNQNAMTAAHRSLPFGTKVLVTNLNNGRSTVVRINDRGPFVRGRVIDLSAAAARVLGVMQTGIAPVQVQVLGDQQADPQTVASDNY
ncbi:septal ring lytic transglycosylase RlpA family protein [Allocoleopsis sp.]|uniref:septal ring lytic transglycosylase RlpA family protein n=1 Tax=Allocoleopsis sp. TaxID=3088169 RepID=UPI002FD0515B